MTAALIFIHHSADKRHYLRVSLGILMLIMFASTRYDACPALLPFIIALGVFSVWQKQWRRLAALLLTAGGIVGVYLIQPLCANVSLWERDAHFPAQNLIEVNDARMRFCDYYDMSGKAEEKREDYLKAGLSSNDLSLLETFFYIHEARSSSEWWRSIRAIRDRDNEKYPRNYRLAVYRISHTIKSLQVRKLCTDIVFVSPFVFWILYVLIHRKIDAVTWVAAASVASYASLFLIGRINDGAAWSIWIISVFLMVAQMPRHTWSPRCALRNGYTSLLIVTLLCAKYSMDMKEQYSPGKFIYDQKTSAIRQECLAHPDFLYYTMPFIWYKTSLPSCSLLSAPYLHMRNLLPYEHWMYLMPSVQKEFQLRGHSNDRLFLLNEKTRLIMNTKAFDTRIYKLLNYYREHHGISLRMVAEKQLNPHYAVYRLEKEEPASEQQMGSFVK